MIDNLDLSFDIIDFNYYNLYSDIRNQREVSLRLIYSISRFYKISKTYEFSTSKYHFSIPSFISF